MSLEGEAGCGCSCAEGICVNTRHDREAARARGLKFLGQARAAYGSCPPVHFLQAASEINQKKLLLKQDFSGCLYLKQLGTAHNTRAFKNVEL